MGEHRRPAGLGQLGSEVRQISGDAGVVPHRLRPGERVGLLVLQGVEVGDAGGIDGDRMLTLKTNNGGFHASTEHPGAAALDQTTLALLTAVRNKNVPAFVSANPTLVSSS